MLDRNNIPVLEVADAKRNKIAADEAWEVMRKSREIIVGSGKRILRFIPSPENKDAILKHCLGRSGTLRAPALKIGDRFLIGYNDDMYQQFLE